MNSIASPARRATRPPQEILRAVYERDRETFFAHLHPDYECHTPGTSPIAGHFRGEEGMKKHIAQMVELSGGTFRPTHMGQFITQGDWGFVPVQLVGERNGLQLAQRAFGVWRFHEGLLIEHWENPTDMKAFDAFWS